MKKTVGKSTITDIAKIETLRLYKHLTQCSMCMQVLHENEIKHQLPYRYMRVPTCSVQNLVSGVLPGSH